MKPKADLARLDSWEFLHQFTAARIALGRAGASLPTRALLAFQAAHAAARDAIHYALDVQRLSDELSHLGTEVLHLHSAAVDRREYIARPDRGRILNEASMRLLKHRTPATYDAMFVLADGLSPLAVQRHAVPILTRVLTMTASRAWRVAPLCVVQQGRVAISDEIGALLGARLCVILIGERPGLSSPDSLGLYLTHDPRPGRSNAERNCISNVRPEGLGYDEAARRLFYLMSAARQLKVSGVMLKEDAARLLL